MKTLLFLGIAFVVAITGCSNTTQPISIGAAMSGSVITYDTNDNTFDSTASGVTVTLQGTAFHTQSGSDGKWTISGLPPGIYTIVFTKTGYDTCIFSGIKFSGAGVDFIDPATLHLLGSSSITIDSVTFREAAFTSDSNLTIYFETALGAPRLVSFYVYSDNGGNAGWKLLREYEIGGTGPASTRFTLSQIRDIVFDKPAKGGHTSFKAVIKPLFGDPVTSNVYDVDLPSDSLILDSGVVVPGGHGPVEDTMNVVFSGRYTGPPEHVDLEASLGSISDSLRAEGVFVNVQWNGHHFTATTSVDACRIRLNNNANSNVGYNAYFWFVDYPRVTSNAVMVFLPKP